MNNAVISDAVLCVPHAFTVGGRQYALYPPSLGKTLLLEREISKLAINDNIMRFDASLEILRLVKERKRECCRIISYSTFKNKDDVLDARQVEERTDDFKDRLSDEDIARLVLVSLSDVNMKILDDSGINVEQRRYAAACKYKQPSHTLSFGGKTIFGLVLNPVCERYGWTLEYAIWGIPYVQLLAMFYDHIDTVMYTDEEWKEIPPSLRNQSGDVVNADDPNNQAAILNMKWD
jgi:hypothetical protein